MFYKEIFKARRITVQAITAHFVAATICLLASLPAAHGKSYESAERLRATANKFVLQQLGTGNTKVSFGQIDPRLRLPRCETKLSAFWPGKGVQSGRGTVGIRCRGAQQWKIYLPVNIRKHFTMAVSVRPLPRNHVLRPEDLKLESREASATTQFYTDLADLSGMVLRRSIRQGAILSATMVAPPKLVKRGQKVLIVAKIGNLAIRVHGVALMDGHAGQTIRVKNTKSKRAVQAVVVSKGMVKVVL